MYVYPYSLRFSLTDRASRTDQSNYTGGIEIISPPMSAAREWRQEIHTVFGAVAQQFELWTNTNCACHVHVSPGPLKASRYTWEEIIRVANGSFFWEEALKTILPGERKNNRYAQPNATTFANAEYNAVTRNSWDPVFRKIRSAAVSSVEYAKEHYPPAEQNLESLSWFGFMMAGVPLGHPTPAEVSSKYLSSNFFPLDSLGTIENRRQAGVASAQSAIYRALLALTLHGSALRYDFNKAASRKDFPTQKELITELGSVMKEMPKTCHGDRFVKWLNDCAEDYKTGRREFNEHEVNKREDALHARDKPLPPPPAASSSAQPSGRRRANSTARPAPQRQPTTAPTQSSSRTRPVSLPHPTLAEPANSPFIAPSPPPPPPHPS